MNVYFIRHSEAEPAGGGRPDFERPLSCEGEKKIAASLPGIFKLTGQLDYILTSPAARAARTAYLIAAHQKCRNFVFEMPELAAPGSEIIVDTMLNKLIGKENVAVVGHQPYLTELVGYFTGMPPEESISIDKGGMIKVSFKGFPGKGAGKMRWSMSQDDLTKI